MHLALLPAGRRRLGHAVAAALAAVLLLAGYLAVTSTFPAVAAPSLLSQGKPATASSVENAGMPAPPTRSTATPAPAGPARSAIRSGSRSTSAPPPRISQVVLRWEARLRDGLPDPGLRPTAPTWTNDLHHHHRHRRHPDPHRHRHRPLRADERHRPRHRLRLLAVGVPGLRRDRRRRGGCGTANAAQGKPATASSAENAGIAGVNARRRQRRHPLVERVQRPAVDPGRPRRARADLPGRAATGRPPTRRRSRSRSRPTATAWTTIYTTTTGTGGTQTLNVTGTGRYVRMNGTARATAYGYSLWEFAGAHRHADHRPDPSRPRAHPDRRPSPAAARSART